MQSKTIERYEQTLPCTAADAPSGTQKPDASDIVPILATRKPRGAGGASPEDYSDLLYQILGNILVRSSEACLEGGGQLKRWPVDEDGADGTVNANADQHPNRSKVAGPRLAMA
ncbi:g6838 [Coccomyxa elongata]